MRIVASHLAKFLKDLCLVLGRDPDPGITDRNLHRTISLLGVDSDSASFRGELNGIGKKVKKDLFDLALVADEIAKALVNSNVEVDAMLCGSLANKGARVVYCQREIESGHL